MIIEQKFDNCENHGLQHSWKVFELRPRWGDECKLVDGSSYPTEIPIREEPFPFIKKETTHVRKCQNCTLEEFFENEEVRKWVRK
jgi:hypothetical protein